MKEILVFGHQNPDTDSICSALAYAKMKNSLNINAKAMRLGNISKETQFVLDFLKIEAPHLLDTAKNQEVILVDHNEFSQSANEIGSATILEVVDHHRIANFETKEPLYMNVQPVGCTATILYEIACSKNIEIDYELAVLLISAIISDSLLFKSPTCTDVDVEVCHKLNEIAQLDLNSYGLKLLQAGTNLDGFTNQEILSIDSKIFETSKGKYEVAQVNTVGLDEFSKNYKSNLMSAAELILAEKKLDCFIILVTDIVDSNSMAIVLGNQNMFETSFDVKLEDSVAMLPGVVSRKKQIVPYL